MSSYRAGAGRCFSVRRDRIAAFHLDAVESLAGQAGLRVAELDPCLAGLVVKQEIRPSVAVHILDVAHATRLGAVALRWVVGVSETDGARIDSGGIESVSREDGDRDDTVAAEVDRVRGAPRLDVHQYRYDGRNKRLLIREAVLRSACDDGLATSVSVHHGDLEPAVTVGGETDHASIRRPGWICVKRRVLREVRHIAAVGIHRVDLEVAIAMAYESELRSIRRPVRVAVAGRIICEPHDVRAIGVHRVDLAVAVSITVERDLRSIWRPSRLVVSRRVVGQPRLAAPIGVHGIDFEVAVSITLEHDFRSVRRPSRKLIRAGVVCQPYLPAAVGIHRVYLFVAVAVTREHDLAAVS